MTFMTHCMRLHSDYTRQPTNGRPTTLAIVHDSSPYLGNEHAIREKQMIRPPARIGDYERGVAAERERIIKLLEAAKSEKKPMLTWQYALANAIALINGENK